MSFKILPLWLAAATLATAATTPDLRFGQPTQAQRDINLYVPDLTAMARPASSELRELVERFRLDRDGLLAVYTVPNSTLQLRRLKEFYQAWAAKLETMPYEQLGVEGRIDWHLMRLEMKHRTALVERAQQRRTELAPLLPFFDALATLQEQRREFARPDPAAAAAVLAQARTDLDLVRKALDAGLAEKPAEWALKPNKIVALRAINQLGDLSKQLQSWFDHYNITTRSSAGGRASPTKS